MKEANTLAIGNGIYTQGEIAHLLQLPYGKVYHWLKEYWDGSLGKEYQENYSWTINNTQAVSFYTLVEFYVMVQFGEAGVKPRKVLDAHKVLEDFFKTPFPFAKEDVLKNMQTDGKQIFLRMNEKDIVTLDNTKQFNLDFVKLFFKKLDFDEQALAYQLYPLGKDKQIIVNPHNQFGHAVIQGTNIYPETLYQLYLADEPIPFIAYTYDLDEAAVRDAIEFCKAA